MRCSFVWTRRLPTSSPTCSSPTRRMMCRSPCGATIGSCMPRSPTMAVHSIPFVRAAGGAEGPSVCQDRGPGHQTDTRLRRPDHLPAVRAAEFGCCCRSGSTERRHSPDPGWAACRRPSRACDGSQRDAANQPVQAEGELRLAAVAHLATGDPVGKHDNMPAGELVQQISQHSAPELTHPQRSGQTTRRRRRSRCGCRARRPPKVITSQTMQAGA